MKIETMLDRDLFGAYSAGKAAVMANEPEHKKFSDKAEHIRIGIIRRYRALQERAEQAERERDALAADNTRLRGLVVNAEWNSYDLACSWCRYDVEFHHAPSCPAFSAPGVVRAYTPASPSADIGWQGAEGEGE